MNTRWVAACIGAASVIAVLEVLLSPPHLLAGLAICLLGALGAVALATARRRHEELSAAARRGEALHQAMLRSALDAVVTMDHAGRVLEFNPAAETTFGYAREEALGRDVAELIVPPHLRERHRGEMAEALGGIDDILGNRVELTGRRSDGGEFPVEVAIVRIEGTQPPVFTGYLRDITERRRAEERLTHQALHDALTGAPGRTLFIDRLARALTPKRDEGAPVAVLFVDLDRFKAVNDSIGHDAGDRVLVEIARRCRTVIRPEDTFARMSGDEFTILCPQIGGEDEAVLVAARVKQAVEAPIQLGDRRVHVTASVGVATATAGGATAEGLLSDADTAMYRAKQLGSVTPVVFDGEMRSSAGERLELERELAEAFERDQLVLHYQLQVDLRTGRPAGVEALVRWDHPARGLLPPAEFVPVAEESGLILRLGEVVLEQACAQARLWAGEREGPPFPISLNLSPQQFASPGLIGMVRDALDRFSLPGSALCFEITERTLLSEGPATVSTLDWLSGMGVRLAIDDFGTGYSSLSYLQLLPVNTLKVDSAFVDGLPRRRGDRAIVGAVVQMAHALDMDVVAEGVETHDQVEELRMLDCDRAQGFRFAQPLPPEQLRVPDPGGELLAPAGRG